MKKLTRRQMLQLSGTAAAGVVVAASGCTTSPASGGKPNETVTEVKAPNGKVYRRPNIIRFHPDQKSKVVQVHGKDAWNGDTLSADVLRKMVDTGITTLTGIKSTKEAWQALFKPSERIAIKVNVFRNSLIWTHPQLVKVVTDSLQEAGIPPEQIVIYDYYTDELKTGGFTINKDGPGVRCYGTDLSYANEIEINNRNNKLSDILMDCDALINMPILKSHMMAGTTFALKNHYGSVNNPDGLHDIAAMLPALNALPYIKEPTRLVIGDILAANTKYDYSFPYWKEDARGDSVLFSFDPLAHDTIGYQILTKMAEEKGNPTKGIAGMTEPWLKTCAEAGLGTSDKSNIDFVEI